MAGKNEQYFWCFTRIGDGQDDILTADHTDVTMTGLGGMQKKCWTAGTGQSCGYLARYVAGFTHSGDRHAAFAGQQTLARGNEVIIYTAP